MLIKRFRAARALCGFLSAALFAPLLIILVAVHFVSRAQAVKPTRILMVSSEESGVFQTGGLAHAVSGLTKGLRHEGFVVDVAMPFYLRMEKPRDFVYLDRDIEVDLDYDGQGHSQRQETFYLLKNKKSIKGSIVFFKHLSAKKNYFDNRVLHGQNHYGPEERVGEAFGAWSKAVSKYILAEQYDLVILNDWHTGLVALFLEMARLEGRPVPKVVMAIHNMAYQGKHHPALMGILGIPPHYFNAEDGIEYYGDISFLKAGILKSDLTYTVSPKYAHEITRGLFGKGLEGVAQRLMAEKRLFGILNGIDNSSWDPALRYHKSIRWNFTPEDLAGKEKGKQNLQNLWNLPEDQSIPIYALTSRLAEQKGYEYIPQAIDSFLQYHKAQFIIIGDGDPRYVEELKALERKHPNHVRYKAFNKHDEKALIAYSDFFVNAAWFEPSGLNQLFALKNGTIPVLSRVGGLSNSVISGYSGFLFDIEWNDDQSAYDRDKTSAAFEYILHRSFEIFIYGSEWIKTMRVVGMNIDNSWESRVRNEFNSLLRDHLKLELRRVNFCKEALKTNSD